MFDTVKISCPWCNYEDMIQTKAGACMLELYDFFDEAAPLDVIQSVSNFPEVCGSCGKYYKPILVTRGIERDVVKCDEQGNDLTDLEEN